MQNFLFIHATVFENKKWIHETDEFSIEDDIKLPSEPEPTKLKLNIEEHHRLPGLKKILDSNK